MVKAFQTFRTASHDLGIILEDEDLGAGLGFLFGIFTTELDGRRPLHVLCPTKVLKQTGPTRLRLL